MLGYYRPNMISVAAWILAVCHNGIAESCSSQNLPLTDFDHHSVYEKIQLQQGTIDNLLNAVSELHKDLKQQKGLNEKNSHELDQLRGENVLLKSDVAQLKDLSADMGDQFKHIRQKWMQSGEGRVLQ